MTDTAVVAKVADRLASRQPLTDDTFSSHRGAAPTKSTVARVLRALANEGIIQAMLSDETTALAGDQPPRYKQSTGIGRLLQQVADRFEAAEPVYDTAAALDSLPLGSVILDSGGMAHQAHYGTGGVNYWSEAGTDVEHDLTSSQLLDQFARDGVPAQCTLLHRGSDSI